MTAIVTPSLRLKNASYVFDAFTNTDNAIYLFASKPTSWTDEAYPDSPTDALKFEREVRDEMISLKKISTNDITRAAFRIDWVYGQYYDMYRDDYDGVTLNGVDLSTGTSIARDGLMSANFYVMTDEYNVYKCIYNAGKAASTIKPTGTSTSIFTTSDGYKWKFMYSINSSDALKFVTKNFIPVKTVSTNPGSDSSYYNQYLVQSSAVEGRIDILELTSGGTGYAASSTLALTFIGDGSGASGTATTNSSGVITSVSLTSGGVGYTYVIVGVSGASATSATINAIIPPKNGHGSNPVDELYGVYVMTSGTNGDDLTGDTLTDNEYRILGLIMNPTSYGSSTMLSTTTANALRGVQMASGIAGSFSDDENLSNSTGVRGTFVSWNSTYNILKYLRNKSNVGSDFNVGDNIVGATSSAVGVVSGLVDPEVDTNSGEIIYIETRRPIYRSTAQKEDIRITIEC